MPVVSLAELDAINVRNLNELDEEDAIYSHELARFTKEELLALPNFGVKAVEQCRSALDAIGFERPGLVVALAPSPVCVGGLLGGVGVDGGRFTVIP